ncbi:ParB/RepB/Spo0J family partition protein [Aureimonas pseudogalii]|uniref:ParB family chromosome partitioning protein n=1 Tax=Aureimonas pseudogalii TaxID=1744844 RepID=A0A7W6H7P6_9HYPH|nr:ParB/RepB/Spo0J family partition protein [Aureimonas pseudogalii]MBB4000164.1 ParB family chromosome partitioning protein [Aureimonas pseudogalii]
MTTASVRKLALNTLRIAPENARKTAASTASHDELKASIRAHGVMQNLSAYDGKDGFFYVYAGGRRLTALQDLATEGAIEADAKIGCVVKDAKDAAELSLVENVMRAAMHPADEFEAFAALIEQGRTEDEVAERFGVTILHVRKRMKLAAVAPQILALYREGRITQEALMAFTLSDSHERQMEVWTKAEPQATGWNASQFPNTVKRLMNETRVSATSKLARFVGLERYVEAGGPITQDLFSSNDETFLDDVALLHELASQRLEETALPLRALWKWVETAHEMSYETKDQMGRIYAEAAELPDEVAEEFDGLTDRISAFENADDLTEEEHAELAALEERYAEIEAMAHPVYAPDLMALAGVFVTVGHHGDLMIEAGMVRREDMPALVALSKEKEAAATAQREAARLTAIELVAATTDEGSANADHDAEASDDQDEDETATPVAAITQPAVRFTAPRNFKPAREKDETEAGPSMSAALVADLQAIRHQIFQAHLASDFEVAFDLMLFSMCQSAFGIGYSRKPIDVSITQAQTHTSAAHRTGTVSEKILEALKANLRLEWMTRPVAEQFGALCALSTSEKQALFAFATAHGVQQQLSTDSHAIQAIEAAGARMEIAVDQNWRPTAANYFVRVKKDMLLETARETVDHQWAHDHSGGKKADFAKTMELAFSAEGRQRLGIPVDAAARTATWLPVGMAFGGKVEAPLASAETPLLAPGGSNEGSSGDAAAEANVVALPAFLMESGDDEDHEDEDALFFQNEGYDPETDHFAVAAE